MRSSQFQSLNIRLLCNFLRVRRSRPPSPNVHLRLCVCGATRKTESHKFCNTLYHGQPGVKPRIEIRCDRHRRNVEVAYADKKRMSTCSSCCGVPIMKNSVLSSFNLRLPVNVHKRVSSMQFFMLKPIHCMSLKKDVIFDS